MTRPRTTHYRRGSTAACTARIRPPALTAETADVDCGNCERTHAYRAMANLPPVSLPPVPTETRVHPADAPLLAAWIERLAG